MARQINKLTARRVQTLTAPGRHSDGGGLYLVVDKSGAKRWVFIYRRKRDGKQSEMGLGSCLAVSLAEARGQAAEARSALAEGQDPIVQRKKRSASVAPTFGGCADTVIRSLEAEWRNEKHRAQWRASLERYAAPLWHRSVDQIETDDVLEVLKPIWRSKAETASRVRGRIEKVLDAAKAKGHRQGENPARWRGHLDLLLPKRQRLQRGHHAAMPWLEVPAFVAELRQKPTVSNLALEFVILTASRSGEVLRSVREGKVVGARWDEIDEGSKVWIVPAGRMKAGREHRVPLSSRAMHIVQQMQELKQSEFIFPGLRPAQPLSEMALEVTMRRMGAKPYTVHGFRSSFRDWAGETTKFPREIVEQALAHTVGTKVERAYRRGDALEKRRALMEAWAAFCEAPAAGKVVPIRA